MSNTFIADMYKVRKTTFEAIRGSSCFSLVVLNSLNITKLYTFSYKILKLVIVGFVILYVPADLCWDNITY